VREPGVDPKAYTEMGVVVREVSVDDGVESEVEVDVLGV